MSPVLRFRPRATAVIEIGLAPMLEALIRLLPEGRNASRRSLSYCLQHLHDLVEAAERQEGHA